MVPLLAALGTNLSLGAGSMVADRLGLFRSDEDKLSRDLIERRARGVGPSAAEMLASRQGLQIAQSQRALAMQQGGVNPIGALRQASQAGAQAVGQASMAAGQLRADEMTQAQGQLGTIGQRETGQNRQLFGSVLSSIGGTLANEISGMRAEQQAADAAATPQAQAMLQQTQLQNALLQQRLRNPQAVAGQENADGLSAPTPMGLEGSSLGTPQPQGVVPQQQALQSPPQAVTAPNAGVVAPAQAQPPGPPMTAGAQQLGQMQQVPTQPMAEGAPPQERTIGDINPQNVTPNQMGGPGSTPSPNALPAPPGTVPTVMGVNMSIPQLQQSWQDAGFSPEQIQILLQGIGPLISNQR